jgi:hypothetical protein
VSHRDPDMSRIRWRQVLTRAAEIVESYTIGVTLRQLFYRLVAELLLSNTLGAYKALSAHTVQGRRAGTFPALVDRTRQIHRPLGFPGVAWAHQWLREIYRRDRTEDQPYSLYLGVEKNGLRGLLESWFDDLGLPVIALGGYSSEPLEKEVQQDIDARGRPAVLLYAGDFDPSGEDIQRNFVAQVGTFAEVHRIALTEPQVTEYDLPPMLGKATDSRASAFLARYGRLVQVELDALPPDTLRGLFQAAIDRYWDMSAFETALARERRDRRRLGGR